MSSNEKTTVARPGQIHVVITIEDGDTAVVLGSAALISKIEMKSAVIGPKAIMETKINAALKAVVDEYLRVNFQSDQG